VYTIVGAMKRVGIKQARQELPDLIDRAEAGEEIVITRQGRPVAKLVAAPQDRKPLPALKDFRDQIGRLGSAAVDLVREDRDAK
jgi:prevent-host-death family protein